jgi:DNA-binding NarL/FixJ family response regulator
MRVLIVDDHRSFRESFSLAITQMAAFSVVGEAGSVREACALVDTKQADLLVVDLSLKDSDGIALVHELKRRRIGLKVMMLTMHASSHFVREALDAGAQGYALKEQPLSEIIEAMRACARGDRYLCPLIKPAPAAANGAGDGSFLRLLSHREREVALHVIQGSSSQGIADSLCISLKTVETHRAHINRKLGIHSSAELIRLAAMTGLLASQAVMPAPA